MPENIDPHWTEDDDLLADFVLGRVNDADRKRLNDHLQNCVRCREAVDREKAIVSGVRRYAREEMKSRLRDSLSTQSFPRQGSGTWRRAASLAAALLIVFGVGLYNRWFPWQAAKGIRDEQTKAASENETTKAEEAQAKQEAGKTAMSQEQAQSVKGYGEDARVGPPPGVNRSYEAIAAMPENQKGKTKNLTKPGKPKATESGSGGAPIQKDVAHAEVEALTDQPRSTQVWIEGVVLESLAAGVSVEEKKELAVPAPQEAARMDESLKLSFRRGAKGVPVENEVSLRQESAATLPAARQRMQMQGRQMVQALVEQSGEKLDITMFLDTLMDEEQLRGARVEQVGVDSLIVGVGYREFAFKLPTSVLKMQKAIKQSQVR